MGRAIRDLAEPVRKACVELCTQALYPHDGGEAFEILVYCTLRTLQEQGRIYDIGRVFPGRILTNAKPGQSLHNPDENGQSWAFDAVPMIGGKPQWNNDELLNRMGHIGESCGLVWAGRWRGKLRERVHFEMKRGLYV